MPVKATNYTESAVSAARSVLIEITHLLQDYRDDVLVIGGWVPELLAKGGIPPHVGSMDIDLALDHRKLQDEGYRTIKHLLTERGYYQKEHVYPYKFFRNVPSSDGGEPTEVEIDLLAGVYEGTSKRHKHQRLQKDLQPLKIRGCEFAFDTPAVEISVEGNLPDGGKDRVQVRVASVVPFIAMKGIALAKRMKEKDAYDIVYCLQNYPGGYEAVAAECQMHKDHAIVREGFGHIAEIFSAPDSVGPIWYANFLELSDRDEQEIGIQEAFQRVKAFLETLDMP